eukprot:1156532-Pelagomonas_calceolata.AAC.4
MLLHCIVISVPQVNAVWVPELQPCQYHGHSESPHCSLLSKVGRVFDGLVFDSASLSSTLAMQYSKSEGTAHSPRAHPPAMQRLRIHHEHIHQQCIDCAFNTSVSINSAKTVHSPRAHPPTMQRLRIHHERIHQQCIDSAFTTSTSTYNAKTAHS